MLATQILLNLRCFAIRAMKLKMYFRMMLLIRQRMRRSQETVSVCPCARDRSLRSWHIATNTTTGQYIEYYRQWGQKPPLGAVLI